MLSAETKRLIRWIGIIVMVADIIWFWVALGPSHTHPYMPNPATGEVVDTHPRHGRVVYLTAAEAENERRVTRISFPIFMATGLIIILFGRPD
jgi:hypothetical protein